MLIPIRLFSFMTLYLVRRICPQSLLVLCLVHRTVYTRDIELQEHSSFSEVSITMGNFQASSVYHIFGVTRSVNTLPLTGYLEVLSQTTQIKTRGVKRITIELLPQYDLKSGMIARYFRYSANASPKTSLALSLLIRNEEQRVFPQPSLYVEATSLTSMKSGDKINIYRVMFVLLTIILMCKIVQLFVIVQNY